MFMNVGGLQEEMNRVGDWNWNEIIAAYLEVNQFLYETAQANCNMSLKW